MSNLLEHLKEMKSQAELVDAWQKAFDVAISLCTKKDTVIAELQKENERLEILSKDFEFRGLVLSHDVIVAMLEYEKIQLQEKYDKLKAEIDKGQLVLDMAKNEENNQLYFSAYDRLKTFLKVLLEVEVSDE